MSDSATRGPGRPRKNEAEEYESNSNDVITLTEHLVLITRDPMTRVPKKVYDHELPALNFIHQPDNVEIIDSVQVKVAGFDPQSEYMRMQRKYDRKNFQVMMPIYGPDASKIAAMTGAKLSTTRAKDLPSASIKIRERKEEIRVHGA